MSSCRCETCASKRDTFHQIAGIMAQGHGRARKKIEREVAHIPPKFIEDMRQLLSRMRHEGNAKLLTPNQRQFFMTYKPILRAFVPPSNHQLLATKKRFGSKNTPFSEAFGRIYTEHPQAFAHVLKSMTFHD